MAEMVSDCCGAEVHNPGNQEYARCKECHEMALVVFDGTPPKVAVLGSGASAAFAVAACKDIGAEVKVYSSVHPNELSTQMGAFFLHDIPPNIGHIESVAVDIDSIGEASVYSEMQWGRNIPTSFPSERRTERWYSPMYLNRVWQDVTVFRETLSKEDIVRLTQLGYDWVFHSFPLVERTDSIVRFPILVGNQYSHLRDFILYNGTIQFDWVRLTRQFGNLCLEYPHNISVDDECLFRDMVGDLDSLGIEGLQSKDYPQWEHVWGRDIVPETEPLTSEEYVQKNIIPIGRFATWDRKMLSHQAYTIVKTHLIEG
jgi:hypothetical protein